MYPLIEARETFTAEEVLVVAGALGHTSGTPAERKRQERLISQAWGGYLPKTRVS